MLRVPLLIFDRLLHQLVRFLLIPIGWGVFVMVEMVSVPAEQLTDSMVVTRDAAFGGAVVAAFGIVLGGRHPSLEAMNQVDGIKTWRAAVDRQGLRGNRVALEAVNSMTAAMFAIAALGAMAASIVALALMILSIDETLSRGSANPANWAFVMIGLVAAAFLITDVLGYLSQMMNSPNDSESVGELGATGDQPPLDNQPTTEDQPPLDNQPTTEDQPPLDNQPTTEDQPPLDASTPPFATETNEVDAVESAESDSRTVSEIIKRLDETVDRLKRA